MNFVAGDIVYITPELVGIFVAGTVIGLFVALCFLYYVKVEQRLYYLYSSVFFLGYLGRLMSKSALIIAEISDVFVFSYEVLNLLYNLCSMISILSVVYLVTYFIHKKYYLLKIVSVILLLISMVVSVGYTQYGQILFLYGIVVIGSLLLLVVIDLGEAMLRGSVDGNQVISSGVILVIIMMIVITYKSDTAYRIDWIFGLISVVLLGCLFFIRYKQLFSHNVMLYSRLIKDSLTGCYAKNYMIEQIEACDNGVVVFADFNKFKLINDIFGHQKGDVILVLFAHKLKELQSDFIIPGRFGGDEFILLLKGMTLEDGRKITETLTNHFKEILQKENVDYVMYGIGISFGLAKINTDNAITVINRADRAMYASKIKDNFTVTIER